jgi:hypothetical protein
MTKPKKVIIEQLGFGKEKEFRPFTKAELRARHNGHIPDPRSELEKELDWLAEDEFQTRESVKP